MANISGQRFKILATRHSFGAYGIPSTISHHAAKSAMHFSNLLNLCGVHKICFYLVKMQIVFNEFKYVTRFFTRIQCSFCFRSRLPQKCRTQQTPKTKQIATTTENKSKISLSLYISHILVQFKWNAFQVAYLCMWLRALIHCLCCAVHFALNSEIGLNWN